MSLTAARAVLETNSIGFSSPNDLNDPFETLALSFQPEIRTVKVLHDSAHRSRIKANYALLSLTRNPLNALMWAHYGDNHRGVVIGIDTDKAGLNNAEKCLIPAQQGDMIYTATMPRNLLPIPSTEDLMGIGNKVSSFDKEDNDLFKNAFLYKDSSWAYEEEVRVVKNVRTDPYVSKHRECRYSNGAGEWSQIQYEGRPLYCLSIPRSSIVEIYLGRRFGHNFTKFGKSNEELNTLKSEWMNIVEGLQQVREKAGTWSLESIPARI